MIFPYPFLLPPSFLTFVKKPDQPIFLLFRKKMYINLHLLFQNTRKLLSKPQFQKPPPLVGGFSGFHRPVLAVLALSKPQKGLFLACPTPTWSALFQILSIFSKFWSFLAIFGDFWPPNPIFGVQTPIFDPPDPIFGSPNPILGSPDPIFGSQTPF